MNSKQKEQIRELVKLRQTAYTAVLAELARTTILNEVKRTLALVRNPKAIGNAASRTPEEITDSILQNYLSNLNKGGSQCVDRVIHDNGDGTYTCTTEQKFIPWLNDLSDDTANDILDIIGKSESAGVYPLDIAKEISGYMDSTKHRAVTAARTEAQKIRSDARFATFEDQGVQYVQYVTVGDDAVRPEHAMRDGKIYRIEDAPYLGEYNCRCTVTPADYKVKMNGAEVTPTDAITLTEEELTGQAEVKQAQQTKVETPTQTREVLQKEATTTGTLWQEFTDDDMANIQTYDQLEQAMATRWGLADLKIGTAMAKDIDFGLVKDNVLTADKLMQDLQIKGLIDKMESAKAKNSYMGCRPDGAGGSGMIWYKGIMGDAAEAKRKYALDVASGYHPKGTDETGILTHELGHSVEWKLCLLTNKGDINAAYKSWRQKTVAHDIVGTAVTKYKKTKNIKIRGKKEIIKDQISLYALYNDQETLAEAFADYYANKDKASDLSKIIIETTKEKLEEHK